MSGGDRHINSVQKRLFMFLSRLFVFSSKLLSGPIDSVFKVQCIYLWLLFGVKCEESLVKVPLEKCLQLHNLGTEGSHLGGYVARVNI